MRFHHCHPAARQRAHQCGVHLRDVARASGLEHELPAWPERRRDVREHGCPCARVAQDPVQRRVGEDLVVGAAEGAAIEMGGQARAVVLLEEGLRVGGARSGDHGGGGVKAVDGAAAAQGRGNLRGESAIAAPDVENEITWVGREVGEDFAGELGDEGSGGVVSLMGFLSAGGILADMK